VPSAGYIIFSICPDLAYPRIGLVAFLITNLIVVHIHNKYYHNKTVVCIILIISALILLAMFIMFGILLASLLMHK
jgi:hypothetical protein